MHNNSQDDLTETDRDPRGSRILFLFLFVLLVGCGGEPAPTYTPAFSSTSPKLQPVYLFGVHPLHNPKRLHEVFGPLTDFLSENLNGARIQLEASRSYASYDEKLNERRFHFALPNPYQTLQALQRGYRVFGKMADDENFRGIILVRADSNIARIKDLKGKAISFPAPTALAATMLPLYFLHTQGLDAGRDIDVRYVGSQESSIMDVYLGNVAAAATWPPPWRAFSRERPELARQLKVAWQTESLPNNSLVVRDDVPASIEHEIARLLFTLHEHKEGQAILNRMELGRFQAADSSTYEPVKDFLTRFRSIAP